MSLGTVYKILYYKYVPGSVFTKVSVYRLIVPIVTETQPVGAGILPMGVVKSTVIKIEYLPNMCYHRNLDFSNV